MHFKIHQQWFLSRSPQNLLEASPECVPFGSMWLPGTQETRVLVPALLLLVLWPLTGLWKLWTLICIGIISPRGRGNEMCICEAPVKQPLLSYRKWGCFRLQLGRQDAPSPWQAGFRIGEGDSDQSRTSGRFSPRSTCPFCGILIDYAADNIPGLSRLRWGSHYFVGQTVPLLDFPACKTVVRMKPKWARRWISASCIAAVR